jgi:hypothetical protein
VGEAGAKPTIKVGKDADSLPTLHWLSVSLVAA